MELIILPSHDVDAVAARLVADDLRAASPGVLGVATGSSPLGVYAALERMIAAGDLDLSRTRAFALDEYVGIPIDHPESYAAVIRREVVERLGMNPAFVRVPDGRADDLELACAEYEAAIRHAGGIDVQILGIGANGHIGFNEPSSSLASRTRVKTLTRATREANARFFDDVADVPTHCLTQGIGTILDAQHLVLVARGEAKAEAIRQAAEGPVSARWPASALQLHPNVTLVVDDDAASHLELGDYYRETYRLKPAVEDR
ncbi:glucosamine-6-phosphate deaminase [Agromyces atrinae]|uniref:glucosamine-6-phosphate deaminase n=1 Tax=Agromyces atrinae TaxID=592376 RepID=UPI001F59B44E|nr:glucosamine-6-phosphate deaminase [Agromyces atrinae]MCI2957184.1 glucosamine-6-phosphate deaminase [Agromyces atrinae]